MHTYNRVIITIMTIVMAAVFGLASASSAYDADDPIVLKCGIDNPPGDMKSKTIKRVGDLVEERTDGRIQFEYFYGGSLIKKPQFVSAVARGIADISTGPVSFITGKIPELSIFEIYGAYELDRFLEMQEAVEPLLTEFMETKGIHHVMVQYSGSTVFAHKKKFLKTPADWQGQKMRLGGRWQSELGKQWGSSPVFMPPGDLYTASQRGVIDGYMLIWDIVYGLKLYEVTPYIIDSGFSNNLEIVTMNLEKWNSMTPEDQEIFTKAVDEVKPWTYEKTREHYKELKQDIIAKGGKIHKLTSEEKSMYLKDALELWPKVREMSGPVGNEFCDIMEEFREK
ncbi:MAG: TRAP transporter substrate-binding protein DctP [Desulfobacteraceae bacterium]|nr:TRAP transporter substrate-binding protein DctP [Desulfobacteraceae bacterium]